MADGALLSGLLRKNNITGTYLAKKARLAESSIYRYYGMDNIKKSTVERLLGSVGITMEQWNEYRTGSNGSGLDMVQDEGETYGPPRVLHQGSNLASILKQKGIKVAALADRLNISRRTVYNWIKERQLPPGVLIEAANVLGVPIASLKGYGTGEKSLEKDVYTLLKDIDARLRHIEQHLQIGSDNLQNKGRK